MDYYIAVLTESESGGWRILFPDVPGCEARATSAEDCKSAAAEALQRHKATNGNALHQPRDLRAIEDDAEWLSRNGIDLSKVIVTMVPMSGA
jgi:predicted RNase H-like HicB family nuclease